jgi:LysR family transcriptional regulator, glycine cleavage system transcriptional activator
MRRLPPLSSLRAFEAAARLGSFKRAASELAVTPTAISHQIRSLEEYIGLSLFKRDVRKVELTEAGVQLFPVLRDGFDSFEGIFRTPHASEEANFRDDLGDERIHREMARAADAQLP